MNTFGWGKSDFPGRGWGVKKKAVAAPVYATLDPAYKGTNISLSGGNLTATNGAALYQTVITDVVKQPSEGGRWYWETLVTTTSRADWQAIGLAGREGTFDASAYYPGLGIKGVSIRGTTGGTATRWYNGGFSLDTWYPVHIIDDGDVLMCDLDLDLDTFKVGINGVWGATAIDIAPSTIAANGDGSIGPAITILANQILTCNFGATAFAHTPPVGANAGWYS